MAKYDLQDEKPQHASKYDLRDASAPQTEDKSPFSLYNTSKNAVNTTLAGLGKLADIVPSVGRATVASVLQMQNPNKKIYDTKEFLQGLNPLSFQRYPDMAAIWKRSGERNPQLSDIVPGYAEPNSNAPWYQPEKGGALDPSLAGTAQFATDNALAMGTQGLASQPLNKNVVRLAMEDKPVLAVPKQSLPAKAATSLTMAPVAGTLPARMVKNISKRLFSSGVLPAEFQGAKFGKKDVAETLYQGGITNPSNLPQKAAKVSGKIIEARNNLLDTAGAQGARANTPAAIENAQNYINGLKSNPSPNAREAAQAAQAHLDELIQNINGTPDIPGSPGTPDQFVTEEVPKGVGRNAFGYDETTTKVIPGEPGTPDIPGEPGVTMDPSMTSATKTSVSKAVPPAKYAHLANSNELQTYHKILAGGLQGEEANSVARTMGPEAGEAVTELNRNAGNLLSSRQGQQTSANQFERLGNRIGSVTGTDAENFALMEGLGGDPIKASLFKKALDASRYIQMPVGYWARRAAENPFTGTLINNYGNQWLKGKTDQMNAQTNRSPWHLMHTQKVGE